MTAQAKETTLEIDEDGTLKLPAEMVEALGTRTVRLILTEDGTLSIKPRRVAIYEIENPLERQQALHDALERLGSWKGPAWPAGYNVRDEIYD